MRRALASVACGFFALSIAGCASDPTRLAPGVSRADAVQQLGQPTAVYALADGERLQYSRLPAGFEVSNVDLDATGRVRSVRQELDERFFASTIQTGVWREADVLRTYGRPFEIDRVSSFEGTVWTWRYKAINERRLLYIYLNPEGLVERYHTGDDLRFSRLPF